MDAATHHWSVLDPESKRVKQRTNRQSQIKAPLARRGNKALQARTGEAEAGLRIVVSTQVRVTFLPSMSKKDGLPPMSLRRTVRRAARRTLERLAGVPAPLSGCEGQQESEFYDRTFEADDYWRRHYTGIDHYCCWTVLVDRLRSRGARRLLEIGCGSGQLAEALHDAGILDSYCGFDFSERRLNHARTVCPDWRFEVADAFKTDLFDSVDYDAALSTEFLEHVEGDLEVLSRLRAGTYFVGTVPNYPFVSHVRHFENAAHVAERYAPLLDDMFVVQVPLNASGKTLYILDGRRNARQLNSA
jgi:SAM-dependent methyltransferase